MAAVLLCTTAVLVAPHAAPNRTWYFRPSAFSSTAVLPVENGKSYASAWRHAERIEWAALATGDTLFFCGVGAGMLELPASLAGLTIDGACHSDDRGVDSATWLGGWTVLFNGTSPIWQALAAGVYRTTISSPYPSSASHPEKVVAVYSPIQGQTVHAERIVRVQNCNTSAASWPLGSFCTADSANASTFELYFRPSTPNRPPLALQLQSYESGLHIVNSSSLTVRNLAMVGPAWRLLNVVGGERLKVENCSFSWASYAGVAFNYYSFSRGGVKGAHVHNNRFYQCACGLYIVNQLRSWDDTGNSDDVHVEHNIFDDIDTADFYGNRDTHAIAFQGGVRNLIEHNIVTSVGGSGITLYQFPGQALSDTIVRYNFISNVRSANRTRNQFGIEYGNSNPLNTSSAVGNNSVYFNVISNVTHAGLHSKAMAINGNTTCSWHWENNVVLDAGVGFMITHMWTPVGSKAHGDCTFNNIFACKGGHCSPQYAHVAHHDGTNMSYDSDVHANNLYWPHGPFFCQNVNFRDGIQTTEGCDDFAAWSRPFGNGSVIADPCFVDSASPPDGLRPCAKSPARHAGRPLDNLDAVADFAGLEVDVAAPDIGAFVIDDTV